MPTKLNRKPNRLPIPGIYKSNNSFFVTVCVEGRVCCLCEIQNGKVDHGNFTYGKASLTPTGEIVRESWVSIANMINGIYIDDFVIMPNHFHGIITFLETPTFKNSGKILDLSQIIAIFKSKSTNLIRRGMPLASQNITNFQWQKSFYDHVIRDEKDLHRIQEYINNNPLNWELDSLNPGNNL